jgi:hypothetical protein
MATTKSFFRGMLLTLAVVWCAIFSTGVGAGQLVVIANPKSGVSTLSHNELVNLYMGRTKKLPSGISAMPIDLAIDSEQRRNFYQQLVNKPLAQVQAYWARLLFTGQTSPPRLADDPEKAINLVSRHEGAIAYVERNQVTSSVTIVFEFSRSLN